MCDKENHINEHIQCPHCGYDWYKSRPGKCSECGLPNSAELIPGYASGKRPALLEYPPGSETVAWLRTLWFGSDFVNLIPGFPASKAVRFGRVITAWTVILFMFLSFLCSLTSSLEESSYLTFSMTYTEFLASITPDRVAFAALRIPVYLGVVLITLGIVKYRWKRRLTVLGKVSADDAARILGLASPGLLVVIITWHLARLASFTVSMWLPPGAGFVAFLFTLAAGWSRWRGPLYEGVKSCTTDPDKTRAAELAVGHGPVQGLLGIMLICYLFLDAVLFTILSVHGNGSLSELLL